MMHGLEGNRNDFQYKTAEKESRDGNEANPAQVSTHFNFHLCSQRSTKGHLPLRLQTEQVMRPSLESASLHRPHIFGMTGCAVFSILLEGLLTSLIIM